jgi:hypothetical protein
LARVLAVKLQLEYAAVCKLGLAFGVLARDPQ